MNDLERCVAESFDALADFIKVANAGFDLDVTRHSRVM
jgi:hypothetical protein